jgi:hypothetical protein
MPAQEQWLHARLLDLNTWAYTWVTYLLTCQTTGFLAQVTWFLHGEERGTAPGPFALDTALHCILQVGLLGQGQTADINPAAGLLRLMPQETDGATVQSDMDMLTLPLPPSCNPVPTDYSKCNR